MPWWQCLIIVAVLVMLAGCSTSLVKINDQYGDTFYCFTRK